MTVGSAGASGYTAGMTDTSVRCARARPRAAVWGAAAAAALLAGVTRAEAAPPKVLAFPYQHLQPTLPDDLGEQTTLVVTREVGHGGVSVEQGQAPRQPKRSKAPSRPSDAPTGNPRAARRAERLVERGVAAMEDGAMPAATRRLEKAVAMLEDNGDAVVADLPKRIRWDQAQRIRWDQAQLAGLAERIRSAGEDPADYVEITYKVPERRYAAWPPAIRDDFAPARTVETGSLKIELQLEGGTQ